MKALVTGGGGFLGRHIVRALLARGDEARVLGRGRYPDLEATPGIECVRADIRDARAVADACRGVDVVFHAAALAGIWGAESEFRSINVDGTKNVIAGCRAAGVRYLVHTSSPSVVFGRDGIEGADESLPYPQTWLAHYPATKAAAEREVLEASGPSLLATALRPHLVWGPGDNHLIPRLVARARAGKLVRVGDGKNRVDVIHVTNAAEAHLAAADRLAAGGAPAGKAYFLSQGEPVRLWEFIASLLVGLGLEPPSRSISFRAAYCLGAALEAAWRLAGARSEPRMTRFLALQLARSHWFDISRARADLGYGPRISTEVGLAEMFDLAREEKQEAVHA